LTLGAPQVIYYGGMLVSRLRYFDADRQRPGLPQDVAALVEKLEADRVVVRLINLSPFHTRNIIIQAGGLGEHQFASVNYQERASDYPGDINRYAAPELQTKTREVGLNDRYLRVHMPPAMEITLDLKMERFAHPPSYTAAPKF
jgi:hypothetical protein